MIDVIFELALINYMVDFLTDALDSSIPANLPDDILVVFRLSKFEALIYRFGGIGYDIFQFERTKLCPLLLHSLQCDPWCIFVILSHVGLVWQETTFVFHMVLYLLVHLSGVEVS